MKISIVLILLLICTSFSLSQKQFATYLNFYGKETAIKIEKKGKKKFTLYIEAQSFDSKNWKAGFIVTNKQYENFIESMKKARNQFQEWINNATKNNIKFERKIMDFNVTVSGYFMNGGLIHVQDEVLIKYGFQVMEGQDGNLIFMLVVNSGKMNSTNNKEIEHKGIGLVYEKPEQIDEFLEIITKEKINQFK